MPTDERGFNRRHITHRDQSVVNDLIFHLWHGPVGYSLRRYTPSLEFFAVLAGILYHFGWAFSRWERNLALTILPYVRTSLRAEGSDQPQNLKKVLWNIWDTTRPSALHLLTSLSPAFVKWMYTNLGNAWQAKSLTFQTLFALSSTAFIALCVDRWIASQRQTREAEPFTYPDELLASTLDAERNNFRLLRIHRWLPWTGVRTTLYSTSITSSPPFEAISYTWGNSAKTHSIIVNGLTLKTTAATYNALYNLSMWYESRLVWIDYVCINQANADEKSSQVGLMKDIYSSATRVIVWLAVPLKPKGLQRWVEMVFRYLRDDRVAVEMIREMSDLVSWYRFSATELSEFFEREERYRVYRLVALSNFLANPWFSRVWIIQEVAMAKEITFMYENQQIEWNHVHNAMESFQEPEMAAALAAGGGNGDLQNTRRFHVLVRIRHDTVKLKEQKAILSGYYSSTRVIESLQSLIPQLPLDLLLTKSVGFMATDPRDKVYSMLGLTNDDSSRVIRPDYESKDTREVYIEAARYVLATYRPLALLPLAGIGDRNNTERPASLLTPASIPNLPSWVPDWTCPPRAGVLDEPLHNSYEETQYFASGTSTPDVTLSHSNVLHMSGAIVDQIHRMSAVCDAGDKVTKEEQGQKIETYGSNFDPTQIAAMMEWHDEAFNLAFLCAYRHRASVEEAFWRTLIGDATPNSRPAPAALGDDYRTWVRSARQVLKYIRQKGRGEPLPPGLMPASPEFAIWGTALGFCAKNRRLCVTKKAMFLGMVPAGTREGDLVAIIAGAKTPYVLRPLADRDGFQLVGECYMDGIMDGEMMEFIPKMERLAIV